MVCCILRSTGWDWTADLLANTPGNTVLHSLYSQASVGCHTGRSSNYLLAAHGPGNSAAKEKEKISPRYAQSIYYHGSKYKRLDYRLWIFRVNHHERKTNPLFPAALLYGYWVRRKKKKKKETPSSSSSPGIGVFRPPTRATLSIPNYPGPGWLK